MLERKFLFLVAAKKRNTYNNWIYSARFYSSLSMVTSDQIKPNVLSCTDCSQEKRAAFRKSPHYKYRKIKPRKKSIFGCFLNNVLGREFSIIS